MYKDLFKKSNESRWWCRLMLEWWQSLFLIRVDSGVYYKSVLIISPTFPSEILYLFILYYHYIAKSLSSSIMKQHFWSILLWFLLSISVSVIILYYNYIDYTKPSMSHVKHYDWIIQSHYSIILHNVSQYHTLNKTNTRHPNLVKK